MFQFHFINDNLECLTDLLKSQRVQGKTGCYLKPATLSLKSNAIFTVLHFLMVWNILKTTAIHLFNMNDVEIPTVPVCLGSRSSLDTGLSVLKSRKSPKNWDYWVTFCKSNCLYNSKETKKKKKKPKQQLLILMAMCIYRGKKAMERLACHSVGCD